jgi:hypothetical protein
LANSSLTVRRLISQMKRESTFFMTVARSFTLVALQISRWVRQHTLDRLNGRWGRFSWFGVYKADSSGALVTDETDSYDLTMLIVTMEALLIEGLEPPQNRKRGDDFRAVEFLQVEDPAIQKSQILNLIDELKKKL